MALPNGDSAYPVRDEALIASAESAGSETSVAGILSDTRDSRLHLLRRVLVVAYERQVPAGSRPADEDQGAAKDCDP